MQQALHPPADIATWIASLPSADQVELTNFYASWYRTLPLNQRLVFFRCLMVCDATPRSTTLYEPGFLDAVARFFNAIQTPWAIHFALDLVSSPSDLALIREGHMLSPCRSIDLDEYKAIASEPGLSASEVLEKLLALSESRVNDKSRAATTTRKRVEAFLDSAAALVLSPPAKKAPIETHPDVAAWLAKLPAIEQAEVANFLTTARAKPTSVELYRESYLLVALAQLDPGPGKRPALDKQSALSLAMPGTPRKITYLTELMQTAELANNKVFIAFALAYLSTPEDLETYRGRSMAGECWEYLDLEDYEAVVTRAIKKGADVQAVRKSLMNRANKNRLTSPPKLGVPVAPERYHQLNKEALIKMEQESIRLVYN